MDENRSLDDDATTADSSTDEGGALHTVAPAFSIDASTFFSHRRPSREERAAEGRARREEVPLASHAEAPVPADRPNPLAILRSQESDREPALIPLRYSRMAADPFAFLRGAAAVMASDLSGLPSSRITVQLCGDAHLANFGMFASAERSLVFDLNDFDETLPGPFDWDVKRLAASFAVAARANGFKDKRAHHTAAVAVMSYRTTMAQLSGMHTLDVWNSRLDVDVLVNRLRKSALSKAAERASDKSRRSTGDAALAKLTEVVDGRRQFRSLPPILAPVPPGHVDEVVERVAPLYEGYLRSLGPDRIALLARFSFVDLAHKVVGVGSVGTRAWVLLLESGDGDWLLLQMKQANESVLEPYLGASRFDSAGKRVVVGQRVMQASGDPFLGWMKTGDEIRHDYYVRQLKDMKGSIDATLLDKDALVTYAQVCGAVLARAHARAGDASTITGYLGDTDEFDAAVGDFAMAYADITDADHAALVASIVGR
jgi:uncharacterized protein (DUF2252 family)